MKWKALFDNGLEKDFEGEQFLDEVISDYVSLLKVKPFCVIINDKGYDINHSINPKGKEKIKIIHLENARLKIAATTTLSKTIMEIFRNDHKNKKAVVVENGKGHFVIDVCKSWTKSKIKSYIKKDVIKKLRTFLNLKEECFFEKVPKIFGDNPDYSVGQEFFSVENLMNFEISRIEELENSNRLFFNFSLDKDNEISRKLEEKQFDHRVVGKELEIFYLKPESVMGMPYWLPNGVLIKNSIKEYLRKVDLENGFREVETPIVGSEKLYQTSGHLDHYIDDMFLLEDKSHGEQFLRPMSCPHHCDIFTMKQRTHNDLPFRISEFARLYRKEHSGGLIGIERVTSMELTDAHIFCSIDQVKKEIQTNYKIIEKVLKKLGIKIHQFTIAIRDYFDDETYGGDIELWKSAEDQIISLAKNLGIDYKIVVGEAAFYGPKIDLEVISTHSQNLSTISTIQLDFFLPKQFNLNYLNENQEEQTVVMIHRGLASTMERLIAFMLTQKGGYFPLNFAPIQIQIIPISISSKEIVDYCMKVRTKLTSEGFRVNFDNGEDTLGKKIRNSQKKKINFNVIIGEEEVRKKELTIRRYGEENSNSLLLKDFIHLLRKGLE